MTRALRRLLPLGLALLAIAAPSFCLASDDAVEYRDDALTVRLTRIPVGKALDAVVRATGAAVRGRLEESGEVTATFENVPLQEALRRLLPKQAFALKYEGDRLAAIELLDASGVVQPRPAPAIVSRPGQTDEQIAVGAALSALAVARQNGMAPPTPTPLEATLEGGGEAAREP